MKFTKYIFTCLCAALMLWGGQAQGQQDPQYTQYMFNQLAYNPAYAGSRQALSGVMLVRKQWVGLEGAPFTGTIALHAPSKNLRHGFGVNLVHDRLGITRQNFLSFSYAYRLPLAAGNLAFGLRGGITHFSNQFTDLNPLENDQMNPGMNLSVLLPRVGAGIYYSLERFYIGFSSPNFLKPTYSFDHPGMSDFAARQETHFFGVMGAVFPLNGSLDFRPSTVVKYVQDSPVELDFNAALFFNKFLWLGVGYRTGDALVGMIELNFKSGMRFGYSYDYTVSELRQVNSGSHEIMLGFDFNRTVKKVITPRYF